MVSSHKNLFNLITSKKVTKQILNKIFHFFTIKLTHSGSLPGQPGSRLVWSVDWLDNINTFQHAFFFLAAHIFSSTNSWPTAREMANITSKPVSAASKVQHFGLHFFSGEDRVSVNSWEKRGQQKSEHHIHTWCVLSCTCSVMFYARDDVTADKDRLLSMPFGGLVSQRKISVYIAGYQ